MILSGMTDGGLRRLFDARLLVMRGYSHAQPRTSLTVLAAQKVKKELEAITREMSRRSGMRLDYVAASDRLSRPFIDAAKGLAGGVQRLLVVGVFGVGAFLFLIRK